jgi:hypothetical protein
MKHHLAQFLVFIFLSLSSFGFSQSTSIQYFRLSTTEAAQLYYRAKKEPDSSFFHTPINRNQAKSVAGHYLQVIPQGEQVKVSLHSSTPIKINLLNNRHDFSILVTDTLGQSLDSIDVFLDQKALYYDVKTQCFKSRKSPNSGILEVRTPAHRAYFQLDRQQKKTSPLIRTYQRLTSTSIGYWLALPVRIIQGPIQYVERSIRYKRLRNPLTFWFGNRGRYPELQGYIALSQPMYRHGDTLRFKAYVCSPQGRPLQQNLTISCQSAEGKNIFEEKINATSPGNYVFKWPFSDSLSIDKDYYLFISADNKPNWDELFEDFRLEDYELDEVEYQLQISTHNFHRGEKCLLTLSAQTANQLPAPDAQVELFLLSNGVEQFHAEHVLVPDTLWRSKENLGGRGEWLVFLPDAQIPAVSMDLTLHAYFSNSTGQLTFKEQKLHFSHLPNPGKVDPAIAEIKVKGSRNADSIRLSIHNPGQVPIWFQIKTRDGLVKQGFFQDSSWNWQQRDHSADAYYLYYQYKWKSYVFQGKEEFRHYPKILQVNLQGPERVFPGQEASYQVSVQHSNGRPAKGVDLSAGAINAQFGDKSSFSKINVGYRRQAKPSEFPLYFSTLLSHPYQMSMTRYLTETFGLKDSMYYQYRYPQRLLSTWRDSYLRQDTFYRTVAEFAPFLVKGGKMQPIFLIYANRKLVYYYDTQDDHPYSFVGLPGYNQITIRTRDCEYVLDSVYLRLGEKLEIVLNEDFWRGDIPKKVTKTPQPSHFTPAEKNLVNQSIFVFHEQQAFHDIYIWDKTNNIHRAWNTDKNYKAGPFDSDLPLQVFYNFYYKKSLDFQPGFSYDLETDREKLFHFKVLTDSLVQLPYQTPSKLLGQRLISPKFIIPAETTISTDPLSWLDRLPTSTDSKFGLSYMFKYTQDYDYRLPDSLKLRCIVLRNVKKGIEWVQSAVTRSFSYLPKGDYELFFFNRKMEVSRRKIRIRQDTLLYEDLSMLRFQKEDSLYNFLIDKYEKNIHISDKNTYWSRPLPDDLRMMSGRILSEEGEPLPGVGIRILGFNALTISDMDGHYSLKVPKQGFSVAFSYIGFETQEHAVPPGHTSPRIDVTMNVSTNYLSETVVTAHGVQRSYTTYSMELSKETSEIVDKALDAIAPAFAIPPDHQMDTRLPSNSLRKNFRDHAFWQPQLRSNRYGEAFFKVKFPDNITSWKTFVIAADKKQQRGLHQSSIQSYQPLMAQLNLPRFLIHGDATTLNGRVLNYSNDTLAIRTFFQTKTQRIFEKDQVVQEGLVDKAEFQAPVFGDSIQLGYALEIENGYQDGEERSIPLLPAGTLENDGIFFLLDRDTLLYFEGKKGSMVFRVAPNALSLLLEDIQYLKDYAYSCNEQSASKLIGLLAEKQIRKNLKQPFSGEKMILELVSRLNKAQNPDGSWSWWPGGNIGNAWMSSYVVQALFQAQEAGYKSRAIENGLRWLTRSWRSQKGTTRLRSLQTLIVARQSIDTVGLSDTLARSAYWLSDRLLSLWIKQALDYNVSLDQLSNYRSIDVHGGVFWEEKQEGHWNYDWYNNRLSNTLLAYQIAQKAGLKDELRRIRIHLMANRGYTQNGLRSAYGWRNTLEVAAVLKTILPDLLLEKTTQLGRLQLSGALTGEVSTSALQATFDASQPLTLKLSGPGPFFCTAYQQSWNPNPQPKSDLFAIKSHLEQNGAEIKQLQFGKPAQLVVEIEVKQEAQYAMIEIPIPAGCSYFKKPQSYRMPEVHREYFAEKVSIFCERLPIGKQRFVVDLEPRFSGNYTLNPVRVEEMYFPVLYGRNGVEKVQIRP